MRTRLAWLLLLVAVVVIAVVILRYPAARPTRPVPPVAGPGPVAGGPCEVVRVYLTALEERDYRRAYELLSSDSQAERPYREFVSLCEGAGFPSLDVEAAQEKPSADDRAIVVVPMVEDPAEAGFTLVKEGGVWKIVFMKGSPWFPYP